MKLFIAALMPLALVSISASGADAAKPVVTDKSSPDYVRCETQAEIGSRVRKTRVCHTNAEWLKLKDISGKQAREMADPGRRSAPPGN
jgi:hypothetical protein